MTVRLNGITLKRGDKLIVSVSPGTSPKARQKIKEQLVEFFGDDVLVLDGVVNLFVVSPKSPPPRVRGLSL